MTKHVPVHVTMRLVSGLRSLRKKDTYRVVKSAIEIASKRIGFAVVHYSVQSDHLHLLIEADGNRSLARGIQALTVRLARNLNKLLGRSGTVFGDRYHLHVLATPRQVHHALAYVLGNARRHAHKRGMKLANDFVDPISSSFIFDGWENFPSAPNTYGFKPPELPRPKCWLMRKGWRTHGLLNIQRIPI